MLSPHKERIQGQVEGLHFRPSGRKKEKKKKKKSHQTGGRTKAQLR